MSLKGNALHYPYTMFTNIKGGYKWEKLLKH